jgi:hypothetical protein
LEEKHHSFSTVTGGSFSGEVDAASLVLFVEADVGIDRQAVVNHKDLGFDLDVHVYNLGLHAASFNHDGAVGESKAGGYLLGEVFLDHLLGEGAPLLGALDALIGFDELVEQI